MQETSEGKRILIVDDNEYNLELLEAYISADGYKALTAEDGYKALQLVESENPDLILLDVMMPEIDGYEVCRRIKQNPLTQIIPVIMVTVLEDDAENRIKAIKSGADDFIQKPVHKVELLARVRSLLRIKSLHGELERKNQELKAKNRDLIKANQLREDLSNLIIHDMKNPLAQTQGALQLLQRDNCGMTERNKRYLAWITESTDRLFSMVSDLLFISKLEGGELPLKKETISINRIIRDNLERISASPYNHACAISCVLDETLPPVVVDRDVLDRVVGNLLSNATKYTPQDGKIWVETNLVNHGEPAFSPTCGSSGFTSVGSPASGILSEGLKVTVADNGPGVPEEYREKIFEKFFQAQAKREHQRISHGLGLTFCKLAVEAHGGRIWVESQEGKGSKFSFTIPVEPQIILSPKQ